MLCADLKVLSGRHEGKIISLTTKKFLIGRGDDCHMRPNNDLVSRHHCIFNLDDYSVRLRDLGSTNGTFVNGEQLRGQTELHTGDQVRIGKLELEVTVKQAAEVAAGVAEEPAVQAELPGETVPEAQPFDDQQQEAAGMETMQDTGMIAESDTSFIPAADAPPPLQYAPGALPPGYQYPPQGYPPQGYPQPGYPQPGYPPQGQYPYGYPPQGQQFPPGQYPQQPYPYPPQGGYPQYPPGQYPPGQPMPGGQPGVPHHDQNQPAPEEAAEDATEKKPSNKHDVKLPDPSETGVKEAPAQAKAASSGEKAENPASLAEQLIQQYTRRRPGGTS